LAPGSLQYTHHARHDLHDTATPLKGSLHYAIVISMALAAMLLITACTVDSASLQGVIANPVLTGEVSATALAQAARPELSVIFTRSDTFVVSGRGFTPGEGVQLFLSPTAQPMNETLVAVGTVTATVEGTFTLSGIVLPTLMRAQAYLIACGTASGETGPQLITPATAVSSAPTPLPPNQGVAPDGDDGFTPMPSPVPAQVTPTPNTVALIATAVPTLDPNQPGVWQGVYYANRDLREPAFITRTTDNPTINYASRARPFSGMPNDYFSVRWTGVFTFNSLDNYIFQVQANDGVRLYVDDDLLINEWRVGRARNSYGSRTLTAGAHRLRLEYYNLHTSSRLWVNWKVGYLGWEARYYNGPNLDGPVVYKRDDLNGPGDALNMNWGDASAAPPAPGVNIESFSVDWERHVLFQCACLYNFNVDFDDGVRIYIDQKLVFDQFNGGPGNAAFSRYMHAGRHFVQIQYAQRGGTAYVHVRWEPTCPQAPTARPPHLQPVGTVDP
jgi:hypothetical protein